jgi:ABC-2 type transport system ATP-binding protein
MIKIRNLIKRYGQNIAVDNINLDIYKGEIFGLLGPNGAGKSTTINMICGLLKIDQGEVILDGINIQENPLEAKKRLGLVPQEIAIFDTLTAKENITFFGKLSGLRGNLLKERVDEALEFVGLSHSSNEIPKKFSGGMKRRLNIACALVHHPKLIVMDEPTVGIDAQSRKHILDSICKLNKMGSTIIYTSHYIEEVQSICNRIAIIDHGRLVACGTKNELKNLVSKEEKIIVEVIDFNYNFLEELKIITGVKDADFHNGILGIITSNAQNILQDVLFILSNNNVVIKSVKMIEPDLESVFLSLTGRSLRD